MRKIHNEKMDINTKLGIVDYMAMVNEISEEYFDITGEYQPQFGELNAMRLFYNKCVTKSKFDERFGHNIVDALDMESLVADKQFIEEYNKAITGDGIIRLDFCNAYRVALDIVKNRKSSIESIINSIKNGLNDMINMLSPALSDENMSNISKIAESISNGGISADAIVEAYGKSKRFQDVVNSKDNVIDMNKDK